MTLEVMQRALRKTQSFLSVRRECGNLSLGLSYIRAILRLYGGYIGVILRLLGFYWGSYGEGLGPGTSATALDP